MRVVQGTSGHWPKSCTSVQLSLASFPSHSERLMPNGVTMRRTFFISLLLLSALSLLSGCSGVTKANSNTPPSSPTPPSTTVTVSVSPSPISLRIGGAPQTFTASVSGTSNSSVSWQVNGVAGGSAEIGTISASGVYTLPASLPTPNTVSVRAVSMADSSALGDSAVTLLNPVPTLSGIAPTSVPSGSFTITASGSNFVNGAQVLLAGTPRWLRPSFRRAA